MESLNWKERYLVNLNGLLAHEMIIIKDDLIPILESFGYKIETKETSAGYLGWANRWSEEPEIYIKCNELEHKRQYYNIGHCQHMETCETCGYWYKYDSS